jgi:hypothetical protein
MQNDRMAELKAEIERLKGVIAEFGKGEGKAFRAATIAACNELIAAYKHEAREAIKRAETAERERDEIIARRCDGA